MLEVNKYDLSICIPTYNRCEILDSTLHALFSNPDFDAERVEVIVSDNCSLDNTTEIVAKYPLAKYYRNIENVRDRNFSIVLGYATGHYIRLFNDTIIFKPGALKLMLSKIRAYNSSNQNIFFCENMFLNNKCIKEVAASKDFLEQLSFYSTWIGNFGAWKEDFLKIQNIDDFASLQLSQVDWCYQIVKNGKRTFLYFDQFFEVVVPNKKGGYNVFKIFVDNYLHIISQHKVSVFSYELEKYRLFRYFIYPWLIKLFITESETFDFDVKGAYRIIFVKYWYEPYFYAMIFLFLLRTMQNKWHGK